MGYLHTATDCAEHHDLVRDFGHTTPDGRYAPRPTITVLCGSTRFGEAFRDANLRLTLDGHIVLSIGCDTKSDDELAQAGVVFDQAFKDRLDELHKRKIDLADEVFVLNVASEEHPGGYIGDSTRSEIEYATKLDKPIRYLVEPDYMRQYRELWAPIIEPNGILDRDQIARELADYTVVTDEVSKVYDELTGGRLSKPNTAAHHVIAHANDRAAADHATSLLDALYDQLDSDADRAALVEYATSQYADAWTDHLRSQETRARIAEQRAATDQANEKDGA